MDRLPVELLESIFSHLPLNQLLTVHTRVCRKWRNIISREQFLLNKKQYYKYTAYSNKGKTCSEIEYLDSLFTSGLTSVTFLPWMLKRMKTWTAETPTVEEETFQFISNHSLFSLARDILQDRFPDLAGSNSATLTLITLIAKDVYDVREIIKVLVSGRSSATSIQVTEILYHIGSLLLVSTKHIKIPCRLHYLVYYALYLYENTLSTCHKPEMPPLPSSSKLQRTQQKPRVPLTAEQMKIVNYDLKSLGNNDILRIMAYAGTGKTTTLLELCKKNPGINFLLVVFNKSVQEQAQKVFPDNVESRTAHSLSYGYIKDTYHVKPTYDLKYFNLVGGNNQLTENKLSYSRAAMVIQTLNNFYNSSDQKIGREHTPDEWPKEGGRKVGEGQKSVLITDASSIWSKFTDENYKRVKFGHDSGLKAFQLSRPTLSPKTTKTFDILLIDEAQDMNPAMLDICLSQKMPKIFVGDPHQQIYAFRGAVDALTYMVGSNSDHKLVQTLYLTQSFRFGPEIAFTANSILKALKDVQVNGKVVKGAEHPILVGGKTQDNITVDNKPPGKTAIIGRTNVRLFDEMVELVCLVPENNRPQISISRNQSDRFENYKELEQFRCGQIKKKYGCDSWDLHVRRVKDGHDLEALGKIEIVEKYREKITEYVNILNNQSLGNSHDNPSVKYIFSTVHQFKGLECETVRLLDDFFLPCNLSAIDSRTRDWVRESSVMKSLTEEINLLYVALTRARRSLILNDSLFFLLTGPAIKHTFQDIVPANDIVGTQCVRCALAVEFEDGMKAGVVQHRVQVLRQAFLKGGSVCRSCASAVKRWNCHTLSRTHSEADQTRRIWFQVHAIGLKAGDNHFNKIFSTILSDPKKPHDIHQAVLFPREVERMSDAEWKLWMESRENRAEPQPENRAEPQPENQADPQPENQAEPQPENQAEPQPENQAEPQPENQTKTTKKRSANGTQEDNSKQFKELQDATMAFEEDFNGMALTDFDFTAFEKDFDDMADDEEEKDDVFSEGKLEFSLLVDEMNRKETDADLQDFMEAEDADLQDFTEAEDADLQDFMEAEDADIQDFMEAEDADPLDCMEPEDTDLQDFMEAEDADLLELFEKADPGGDRAVPK